MTERYRVRRGFALVAVLWLVVAIAAVVLDFSLESRERRTEATNLVEHGQAYAAALAAIEIAGARLTMLQGHPGPGTPPPYVPDSTDPWWRTDSLISGMGAVGSSRYAVVVRDAGAMVNINAASEDNWRSFLTGVGITYDAADRLAQAIMDWRDPDDDARPRGAERAEYVRAGHVVLPANKDFASVAELRNVLGMTPDIYARIAPYLTVSTSTEIGTSVNVNSAPPPVLRMLYGFTDDVVATVLGRRASGVRFKSMADLTQAVGSSVGGASGQPAQAPALTFQSTGQALVRGIGWSPGGHTRVTLAAVLAAAGNVPVIAFIREE